MLDRRDQYSDFNYKTLDNAKEGPDGFTDYGRYVHYWGCYKKEDYWSKNDFMAKALHYRVIEKIPHQPFSLLDLDPNYMVEYKVIKREVCCYHELH
jgi:hypothetical protein